MELLDTLQGTAPVGFGFIDTDLRVVRANAILASCVEIPVAEQIGQRLPDLPELWPRPEGFYRSVLETGEPVLNLPHDVEPVWDRGHELHWLTSLYPVAVEGKLIGVGVVVADITEQREAALATDALLLSTVVALGTTVEARDPYTAGHQRRVADIATAIALELGMDGDAIRGIGLAATIHDIGKLMIPAEVLARPGPLRPGEWARSRNIAGPATRSSPRSSTRGRSPTSSCITTSASTAAATPTVSAATSGAPRPASSPLPTWWRPWLRTGRTARRVDWTWRWPRSRTAVGGCSTPRRWRRVCPVPRATAVAHRLGDGRAPAGALGRVRPPAPALRPRTTARSAAGRGRNAVAPQGD